MYENEGIFSRFYNLVADFGGLCADTAVAFFKLFLKKPLFFIYFSVRKLLRLVFRGFVLLFAPGDAPSSAYADDASRAAKKSLEVLFTHPKSFPYVIAYYIKKATSRYNFGLKTILMWIIPLVVTGAVIFSAVQFSQKTLVLEISADGEVIGCCENEKVYLNAKNRAKQLLSQSEGKAVFPEITYSLKFADKNELTDEADIIDDLISKTDSGLVSASGVYADGRLIAVLHSENDARSVLENVLSEKKALEENYAVSFSSDIKIEQGLYPEESISTVKEFNELLMPDEEGNYLLGIKEIKSEIVSETVPFDKIEIKSSALYSGSQRVLSEGKNGFAQVTNFVTYINGERKGEKEVSRLTVTEPVPQRLQVGTKPLDEAYSNSMGGIFLWPIVGAYGINSDYGYRWGKLHAGLDLGMGNAPGTSLGKNIIAVASGVVQVAAVHSSYGYYLILDHGNGLQTLYAHCYANSFMVVPGQTVVAGQPIAKVGSTGYSTGPHLHFEVRVNGNRVNPRPYLGI